MQLSKQYGFTGRASCGPRPGFALPVSPQIKADSALPRAACAPLIAQTEPRGRCGRAVSARSYRPLPRRRSPLPRPQPPLIASLVSPLLSKLKQTFSVDFKLPFSVVHWEGLMPLLFFFKEVPHTHPQKPNLNSEPECCDVLCSLGAQIVLSLTICFHLQTRRKTLH